MLFEEKTITLKNGKSCLLSPADPHRAADMIEYLRTVSGVIYRGKGKKNTGEQNKFPEGAYDECTY